MTVTVNDDATVNSTIKSVQEALQKHLDTLPKHPEASRSKTIKGGRLIWPLSYDPVRTKNLQKINGFLLKMLRFNPPLSASYAKVQPLISILNLIKCPETLSSDSVWEQADLLEIELVELGDDNYIYLLLKEQQKSYSEWERYFLRNDLDDLLKKCSNGTFQDQQESLKARRFLVHLLQARMNEYRRDRAKAQLRGDYLGCMARLLFVLVSGFTIFYIVASPGSAFELLLVLFAGAAGSILSRAIKLGRQPLHAEPGAKPDEVPLGIRALISDRKAFLAQPVIGATTALILFLVFQVGLIQIRGVPGPPAYGLVGFLGGFSEPFVLGVIDKVAGQWGSTLS